MSRLSAAATDTPGFELRLEAPRERDRCTPRIPRRHDWLVGPRRSISVLYDWPHGAPPARAGRSRTALLKTPARHAAPSQTKPMPPVHCMLFALAWVAENDGRRNDKKVSLRVTLLIFPLQRKRVVLRSMFPNLAYTGLLVCEQAGTEPEPALEPRHGALPGRA